jgi:hypothetical protein
MTDLELIALLRCSRSGTSEAMLEAHGVTLAQRARFIRKGLARIEVRTTGTPPMDVTWYFSTEVSEG